MVSKEKEKTQHGWLNYPPAYILLFALGSIPGAWIAKGAIAGFVNGSLSADWAVFMGVIAAGLFVGMMTLCVIRAAKEFMK